MVPCCAAVGVFLLFAGAVMKVPVRKKEKENERERESNRVGKRERERSHERSSPMQSCCFPRAELLHSASRLRGLHASVM